MKNLETNKIAAAILIAGLIALVTAKVAESLYGPEKEPEKRGYKIEVAAEPTSGATKEPEKPLDIKALMAKANADEGQKVFQKCMSCHSKEKGENRVGPSLYGVINAQRARHADFAYSDAMKNKGGTWTYDELFSFLKGPAQYIPGTKMTFIGLRKPEDIANVIAFLEKNAK